MSILYYVHDPMCGWCWTFRPVWLSIQKNLPKQLRINYILGGLAPDSSEPMPELLQKTIQGYWHKMQSRVPGTQFNFDFWTKNTPRRSTYPSCRAVLAAKKQGMKHEKPMILAIQQAYYLNAQNPADDSTLIQCANQLGLDSEQFKHDLNSPEIRQQLLDEIGFAQQIGARGFPSMMLTLDGNNYHYVPLDYNNPQPSLDFIQQVI